MKCAVALFALVALVSAAPQPRRAFHEHVEDFLNVIWEEAGQDLEHIMEHYQEFEEFQQTVAFLSTANFRELVNEMESLPEFRAVIEFLENDNIDILYFIDRFNEMIGGISARRLSRQHILSGTDFSAFIKDSISEFPKDKLAALFDQKIAEDEAFKTALENLDGDEWRQTFDALWQNEVFQNEVQTLEANGVKLTDLFDEVMAVFGQN